MKKINLYDYQIKTVKELSKYDRCVCGLDMGLGKTIIAIAMVKV